MPSLISSHVFWPTSLMNNAAGAGLNANVNGLRRPSAQIARFLPVAVLKNGLSVGIVPSALTQHLAEQVVQRLRVRAVGVLADRDVELAVGAEVSAPPLWLVALLRLSSSRRTVSLPATATSPLAVKRLTRLWIAGVVGRVVDVDEVVGGESRDRTRRRAGRVRPTS